MMIYPEIFLHWRPIHIPIDYLLLSQHRGHQQSYLQANWRYGKLLSYKGTSRNTIPYSSSIHGVRWDQQTYVLQEG